MADLDAFTAWQSDPDVARHVAWLPKTHAESQAELEDAIAQQTATPRVRYFFAVIRPLGHQVVGGVGFTITSQSEGNCGWFILSSHWNYGFATEAARGLLAYAFQTIALDCLRASCSSANPASEKVMLHCGFKCVHKSDERLRYEITKQDWLEQAQQKRIDVT